MAILVGTALLAAEAYQLLMTVERTIAMRDARQAPIIAQATAREKASQRDAGGWPVRMRDVLPGPGGQHSIAAIRTAYLGWWERTGIEPLPVSEIGAALEIVFRAVGLQLDGQEMRGIGWRPANAGNG